MNLLLHHLFISDEHKHLTKGEALPYIVLTDEELLYAKLRYKVETVGSSCIILIAPSSEIIKIEKELLCYIARNRELL